MPREIFRVREGQPVPSGYSVVDVCERAPRAVILAPQVFVQSPSYRKVKTEKPRPQLLKDTQEVIANNRQKYEGKILEYEGKLNGLVGVFEGGNDPNAQNMKRQVVDLVSTAKEMRQAWVNRLDTVWEMYESLYAPLTQQELDMFETAIGRAEAPMDVEDRGVSLLGGPHVSRAIESGSRKGSTRASEAPSKASGTHRSIATGYSKRPEFSTAVSSHFSTAKSQATARPKGARVAETGSLSRKPSSASHKPSRAESKHDSETSTRASSRHSSVKKTEHSSSSSSRGTERTAKPAGRMDLLKQATKATSLHISAAKSSRR